eukprot:TRINITY_DN71880_c0_g1_i1.p1 TRINITY_DN71880_c0_g1~~TRINITY_DN71880_c0_g1_i1.p1  ORF type:complete len:216 (+),score=42.14 TRINITY_DN71880_c0_g1_i1:47-694(+)
MADKPTKITYEYFDLSPFKAFGRGGVPRFYMLVNDIPFEEKKLPFDDKVWPARKAELISTGQNASGFLPVADIDGLVISEANAIMGYLQRVYGKAPQTAKEEAISQMLLSKVVPFRDGLINGGLGGEEAKKKWVAERSKQYEVAEKFLATYGGKDFIATQTKAPCAGSLALFCAVKDDATLSGPPEKVGELVSLLVDAVAANEKVAAWCKENYGA